MKLDKFLLAQNAEYQVHQPVISSDWRLCPGYLSEGDSDFEFVHVLLGDALHALKGSSFLGKPI